MRKFEFVLACQFLWLYPRPVALKFELKFRAVSEAIAIVCMVRPRTPTYSRPLRTHCAADLGRQWRRQTGVVEGRRKMYHVDLAGCSAIGWCGWCGERGRAVAKRRPLPVQKVSRLMHPLPHLLPRRIFWRIGVAPPPRVTIACGRHGIAWKYPPTGTIVRESSNGDGVVRK